MNRTLNLLYILLFCALLLALSLWSLRAVFGFSVASETSVLDGKLAQAFEKRYDDQFPVKQLGTNLWALLDYKLFGEGRQVPHVVVGLGVQILRVVAEQRRALLRKQRVPIVAHVELVFGETVEALVQRYHHAVARLRLEEGARHRRSLQHEIAARCALHAVSHLESGGTRTDDDVLDVFHGSRAPPSDQVQRT